MSDLALRPATRGQAYSEYANYERDYGLFGEPVQEVRYNWTLRRYEMWTVQPLRKSSDPIDVADPDAMIEHIEEIEKTTASERATSARDELVRQTREKARVADERVTDYLREHGMAEMAVLAAKLGYKHGWLVRHMKKRKGELYFFKRYGPHGVFWGLVGVHDGGA